MRTRQMAGVQLKRKLLHNQTAGGTDPWGKSSANGIMDHKLKSLRSENSACGQASPAYCYCSLTTAEWEELP